MGRMEIDNHMVVEVVDRMTWGLIQPNTKEMIVPKHPFRWIRFAYNDLGQGADEDVHDALKRWEKEMFEKQYLPDVPYNFLIGTDGVVYEGRGWHWDADRPLENIDMTTKCLDLCYIGNYLREPPPWKMVYIAHNIILYGLKNDLIWEEVRVMPYKHEKCQQFL